MPRITTISDQIGFKTIEGEPKWKGHLPMKSIISKNEKQSVDKPQTLPPQTQTQDAKNNNN